MELIYVASQLTSIQTLTVILLFLSFIGIVGLTIWTIGEWDFLENKSRWVIATGVCLVVFSSCILFTDWTPRYAEYYKVTDLKMLEEYKSDYTIHNTEVGLYKLVKK